MKTKKVFSVSEPLDPKKAEVRERIISAAQERFFQSGFSKVTMDEIASSLAVSKATLYKHFSGKEDLLRAIIRRVESYVCSFLPSAPAAGNPDFVERLQRMLTTLIQIFSRVQRAAMRDLQRNAPHIWREIDAFRRDVILKHFRTLYRDGVAAGVFRPGLNEEIIVQMYLQLVETMITPDFILRTSHSMPELLQTIFQVFFSGILSDEGRAKFPALGIAPFKPNQEDIP